MKIAMFTLAIILSSLSSYAQSKISYSEIPAPDSIKLEDPNLAYDKYTTTFYDKITGKTSHIGRYVVHVNTPGVEMDIRVFAGSSTPTLHYYFHVIRPKICISKDDEINVLFSDTTRTSLRNISGFNCDGNFDACMGNICTFNTISYLFVDHLIEAVRINSANSSFDVDIPKDAAIELRRQTNGLIPYFEKLER